MQVMTCIACEVTGEHHLVFQNLLPAPPHPKPSLQTTVWAIPFFSGALWLCCRGLRVSCRYLNPACNLISSANQKPAWLVTFTKLAVKYRAAERYNDFVPSVILWKPSEKHQSCSLVSSCVTFRNSTAGLLAFPTSQQRSTPFYRPRLQT